MARGTTLRNIRIDAERWQLLQEVASAQRSNASAVVRDLIDQYLASDAQRTRDK